MGDRTPKKRAQYIQVFMSLHIAVCFEVCRPGQQNEKSANRSDQSDGKKEHLQAPSTTSSNRPPICFQLNSRVIISRAFMPSCLRSPGEEVSRRSAMTNSSSLLAIKASIPSLTGKPLAPREVVMTGQPIAKASSNFTRCPVPEKSGAITTVLGLR